MNRKSLVPAHPGSHSHCCTAPFASLEGQRHKAQQHLFATKAAASASWAVLSSRYELMHDSFSAFSLMSLKATDDASNRLPFTAWIYFFKLLCSQLNGWRPPSLLLLLHNSLFSPISCHPYSFFFNFLVLCHFSLPCWALLIMKQQFK